MENENTGQNESQPPRRKRRKAAAAEINETTEAAQAPADAQETPRPEGQEAASQEPAADTAQDAGEEAAPSEAGVSETTQPIAADQAEEDRQAEAATSETPEPPKIAEPEAEPSEATESDETAQPPPSEAEQAASVEAAGAQAREAEVGEQEEEAEEGETAEPDDRMPDGVPVRQVVEAVLFATDSPLPAGKIAQILDRGTSRHVRRFIAELNDAYEKEGRAFRIEEVAGGYQMLTVPALQPWLAKLLRARQESRLSPTQMETLAVIAYKQPVLRAAVEVVRGVACGDVINRLREIGLVKIVGRAEDVGRPLLYGTTKKFLRVFGLGSLDDLPRVEELRPPEATEAPPPAPAPAEPKPAEAPQEPPPAPANE